MNFKEGDLVRAWEYLDKRGTAYEGVFVSHGYGNVSNIRLIRGYNSWHNSWHKGAVLGVYTSTMEYVRHPLDAKRPLRTRDGQDVPVTKRSDPHRPYGATVQVGKQSLTLTFDKFGHFYPGFDQPYDLVNA